MYMNMNFDLDTSNYSKEDYYEIFNLDKSLSITENLINEKQSQEISQLSSLGFLLVACINYKDLPRENLESKIEEKAVEVKYNLERNLNMLGTLATITPLLGLLGTVVGMITAFTGLSETSGANPDILATGISQALITTAFGLFIAVPGLVLHKYFEQQVTYLLISLQVEVSRFIDVINK